MPVFTHAGCARRCPLRSCWYAAATCADAMPAAGGWGVPECVGSSGCEGGGAMRCDACMQGKVSSVCYRSVRGGE
jgi:hypothetical protein